MEGRLLLNRTPGLTLALAASLVLVASATLRPVRAEPHPGPLPAAAHDAAQQPNRAPPPRGAGQTGSGPEFGLAHIDVMELHAARRADAPAHDVRTIGPEALGRRYALAQEAGARWHRWSLYWDLVERHGTYAFEAADGIVLRDHRAGLKSLVILQGIPAQYAIGPGARPLDPSSVTGSDGAWSGAGAVRDMHRPAFATASGLSDDPVTATGVNPQNPWAAFVDAAVARYGRGGSLAREVGDPSVAVEAWEIGNEPNLEHFWRGSPGDYARFLEVAALVIKRRDPQATVVHAGIADASNAEAWYAEFLAALQTRATASPLPERHGYYYDKAGWHWYVSPAGIQSGPGAARALQAAAGLPVKPVWLTEFGVAVWSEYPGPCWDPASPLRATLDEQSAYVVQAMAEAVAAGVETLIYFQLYDDCGNGEQSYDAHGLVRNPLGSACWLNPGDHACWSADPALADTPRPAFDAYRLMTRELTAAAPLNAIEGPIRRLVFHAPGRRITVAWSPSPGSGQLAVDAVGPGSLHAIDPTGRVRTSAVTPAGGRHVAALPGATNRNGFGGSIAIGGRPVVLVEQVTAAPAAGPPADTQPPDVAVGPLPEHSAAEFTVSVLLADSGSGLAAYRVLYSIAPPSSPGDWLDLVPPVPWTGDPHVGAVEVPFRGLPGATYYFAAHARDHAGNWSPVPSTHLAMTSVPGPTAVPSVEVGPRGLRLRLGRTTRPAPFM